jgi:hypothetical protein
MNAADTLNTVALLLPGYFGAWAMSFMLGNRKREWQQMVFYSLIFSGITYFALLRFTPPILWTLKSAYSIDLSGFQRALNEVSNLGDPAYKLTFHNTVKLLIPASILSIYLGWSFGRIRNYRWFNRLFLRLTNRTQNADIWTDFHQSHHRGPHTVLLKNNDVYLGDILMVSDTLTGDDRGIILSQPVYLQNAFESLLQKKQPNRFKTPGNALIFADQIAAIYSFEHPIAKQLRAKQRKIKRRLSWIERMIWKIRIFIWKLLPQRVRSFFWNLFH